MVAHMLYLVFIFEHICYVNNTRTYKNYGHCSLTIRFKNCCLEW